VRLRTLAHILAALSITLHPRRTALRTQRFAVIYLGLSEAFMKVRNLGLWAIFLAGCNLSASILSYSVTLTGPNESPPTASLGTGFAVVNFDNVANTLFIDLSFSGLSGTTTASHIHCCTAVPSAGTAGVATTTPTFAGFPL